MSERDGYQPGVPCWVDTFQADPDAAAGFYTQLFGWEAEETTRARLAAPATSCCRLRGRDVAAVGAPRPDAPPAWTTYVWVESADDTAAQAADAGGSVVVEPFDSSTAAAARARRSGGRGVRRLAARRHRGAQLVNEPGAWAMSLLNTGDPDGATAFYSALFGWEAESLGEMTLWRLPGYVGGEPQQPVPRDVVAVDDAAATTRRRVERRLLGRRRRRDRRARRGARRHGRRAAVRHAVLAQRRARRPAAAPCSLSARWVQRPRTNCPW